MRKKQGRKKDKAHKKCRKGKIENCSPFWLSESILSQHNKSFREKFSNERKKYFSYKTIRKKSTIELFVFLSF